MPLRAKAVVLPFAMAAWVAFFSAGCSSPEPLVEPEAATTASVGFRYVFPSVKEARDFERISEYLTGVEYTGGDVVVRTQPNHRGGLYFIVGLEMGGELPEGAVATVEFAAGDSPEPRKFQLIVPPMTGTGLFRELRLGVTGSDWSKADPNVMAWRVALRRKSDGGLIVSKQSYLWELPLEDHTDASAESAE